MDLLFDDGQGQLWSSSSSSSCGCCCGVYYNRLGDDSLVDVFDVAAQAYNRIRREHVEREEDRNHDQRNEPPHRGELIVATEDVARETDARATISADGCIRWAESARVCGAELSWAEADKALS